MVGSNHGFPQLLLGQELVLRHFQLVSSFLLWDGMYCLVSFCLLCVFSLKQKVKKHAHNLQYLHIPNAWDGVMSERFLYGIKNKQSFYLD